MKERISVAILFGGRSCEHIVSLHSAASVMENLDKEKYRIIPVGITRDGRWVGNVEPQKALFSGVNPTDETWALVPGPPEEGGLIPLMEEGSTLPGELPGKIDVVFPVLHGTYGEDGTVQGCLELADLPYVGSGVSASAASMDKEMMKGIFRSAGLPVVEYLVLRRRDWQRERAGILREVGEKIGFPCFIKPCNLGSSVGVSKVEAASELEGGMAEALQYDRKIMVERGLDCRELECGILGNEEPQASVAAEIIPKKGFYDYEAKYTDGMVDIVIPASLTEDLSRQVRQLALRAFKALDCSGMARVDFFVERSRGKIYLNELNTIPGFTSTSVYPRLWQVEGLSYPELLDRLIELAIQRHKEKRRLRTIFD